VKFGALQCGSRGGEMLTPVGGIRAGQDITLDDDPAHVSILCDPRLPRSD
jgi:hypothetical protein